MKSKKVLKVLCVVVVVVMVAVGTIGYFRHNLSESKMSNFEYENYMAQKYNLQKLEGYNLIILEDGDDAIIAEIAKWVRDTCSCMWANVDIAIEEKNFQQMYELAETNVEVMNSNNKRTVSLYTAKLDEEYYVIRFNANTVRVENTKVDYFENFGITSEELKELNPDIDISSGFVTGEVFIR